MFDYTYSYAFVILGFLICSIASINVKSTFRKYSRIGNQRGITAEQCAAKILASAGIYDVRIERVGGSLSDHYSPKEKVLRLSDSVYGSTSIAALGVAAHECGHAIQHDKHYVPLGLRSCAVPIANIGSRLYWPVFLVGLLIHSESLAQVGILMFMAIVLFEVITLPVEFNASRRAISILDNSGYLYGDELKGARKMLFAAALTYVAALLSSLLQMLRLIALVNKRRR